MHQSLDVVVTKINTDPTIKELMFHGGRWKIHGSTQTSESKDHSCAGWAHCISLVSSFSDPLSSAHLLKLSLVSMVSCSLWPLSILPKAPYLDPTHLLSARHLPSTFLIDQGFQSQTSSVSQLFSLQRLPYVTTFVPLSFSSVWDHDISFFLVKTVSPPTCLILFSQVTGPFFIIFLLYPLSSTPPP